MPEAIAVASHYQIGPKLGSGGMAEVFVATKVGIEGFARRVAIKRVRSELSQFPELAAMFVAEANIASRLSHPNIVSVLDFCRDAEGRLLLVMEYIDGVDLASVVAAGPLPTSLAIHVIVELLHGLSYAHDLPEGGVIHRDMSPQNVLIDHHGSVKLADFGLAKVRAAGDGVWSETVRGKPSYMSPEQACGDVLDGRADLFAVGTMLWELLAHRRLFTGTPREILSQVIFKDIAPPSRVRSEVPRDLEAVAMKLLARDRRDRFPTADAVIEALRRCGDAPRDGRGELVRLVAERFPPDASRALPGGGRGPVAFGPRIDPRPHACLITVTASHGRLAPVAVAPRRRRRRRGLTLGAAIAAGLIAMMFMRGDAAPVEPSPDDAAARAWGAVTAAVIEPGAPARERRMAGALARPAVAVVSEPPPGSAAARTGEHVLARTPPSRSSSSPVDRARRASTGELAIIVTPWAMVWLNGKPHGQTPFRAPVPAGRYRVRLFNDALGRDETASIFVAPDRAATVERTWSR